MNECGGVNACDQLCVNNVGSYDCSCREGYLLDQDGLSCNGKIRRHTCVILQVILIIILFMDRQIIKKTKCLGKYHRTHTPIVIYLQLYFLVLIFPLSTTFFLLISLFLLYVCCLMIILSLISYLISVSFCFSDRFPMITLLFYSLLSLCSQFFTYLHFRSLAFLPSLECYLLSSLCYNLCAILSVLFVYPVYLCYLFCVIFFVLSTL